uniref:Ig-like domain-containing protein n=1 Tax=Maylandia zebra TaxID=106582 RepID=A0A3P9CCY2_9CICH
YYCIAANTVGTTSEYISIKVNCEWKKLTLTCSSDANPAATFVWYKRNSQALGKNPQLIFNSIQSSDSGEYYCRAVNKLGSTFKSITIVVKYSASSTKDVPVGLRRSSKYSFHHPTIFSVQVSSASLNASRALCVEDLVDWGRCPAFPVDRSARTSAPGCCWHKMHPTPTVSPAGGGPAGGWAHVSLLGCARLSPVD